MSDVRTTATQNISLYDESGNEIGSQISGAIHIEDAAALSGDRGIFALAVRNDAGTALTSNDGDYGAIAVDSTGRIRTSIDVSILPPNAATETTLNSVLGATHLEDAAAVSGDRGMFALAVRNDNFAQLTSNDGDYSAIAVDINGSVRLSSNAFEDNPSSNGGVGQFILGVRNDASAVLTSNDLDYAAFSVDSAGRQKNVIEGSLPAGTNNMGQVYVAPGSAITSGKKSAIGTSAVQITTSSVVPKHAIAVKAENDNTGTVYVGTSTVTNDTADATDGFPLDAGETIVVPVDNANKIYVIGSAAGQDVFWISI